MHRSAVTASRIFEGARLIAAVLLASPLAAGAEHYVSKGASGAGTARPGRTRGASSTGSTGRS